MTPNPSRSRRGRRALLALPLSAALLLGGAGVATATGYGNVSQTHHQLGGSSSITPTIHPGALGDAAASVVHHHADD